MACPGPTPGGDFVGATLRFVDCEARTIGAAGYQALAAPGSVFWPILTGLLTLFVALFGYRMLLGHVPNVREGVLAFVKIGIVLVLATSWPAYQTLVYDTVFRGPAELGAAIGAASGLPGATGGMVSRLETADAAMVSLAIQGAGLPSGTRTAMPPLFAGFEPFALGSARIMFLVGILGAFGAVRLIAGLLLALAPLFVAFLLFDGTRGLFAGWLRVLAGAALGALGTSVILGVQLALIEPWLSNLLAARAAGIAVPSAPVELFVVTSLFAIVLIAMLLALARLAMGFRFPDQLVIAANAFGSRDQSATRIESAANATSVLPGQDRSRAAIVADAVQASQRRDVPISPNIFETRRNERVPGATGGRDARLSQAPPLGHTYRRRTARRLSASAGRRDVKT